MTANQDGPALPDEMSVRGLVADIAGLAAEHDAMAALRHRAGVLEQTDAALRAVLAPRRAGAFSHQQRAALACRIARINGNERLASYYRGGVGGADAGVAAICDPAFDAADDPWLKAVLAFTDLVSGRPKDATERDVAALKAAGLSDPDIVRLAELNAFVAYHVRLIEGFVLMARHAAAGGRRA